MASVNKWIGIGNLGRDPEVRYSPEGAAVCNISVACTSSWKDKKTGERKEETEWVRVVFYNKLAEIAGEYLKKGRPVYIEGRLKTRKWQDKDTGQDRYATEVIAEQMQMLGGREGSDSNDSVPAQRQAPQQQGPAQTGGARAATSNIMDMDDDIPFACPRGLILHSI